MRQFFVLILGSVLSACNNAGGPGGSQVTDTNTVQSPAKSETTIRDKNMGDDKPTIPVHSIYSSKDFLQLKNKELQADFFRVLDSTRKSQYRNNDQDIYNLVDITPDLLRKFLKDINADTLARHDVFEARYFFNIAPRSFTDSKKCDDLVTLRFFREDGSFRMIIDNVYPVEELGCAGGAQVIYGFKIRDNRIVDFDRQAAG